MYPRNPPPSLVRRSPNNNNTITTITNPSQTMAPRSKKKLRGFKFAEFDAMCADLSDAELQLKWQHYTRALTSASTSTTVAVLAAGPTGGVSVIGAMIAGPLLHNARKKRQMVGRHMRARGLEPETRSRDVYVPLAIGTAIGAATMGVGSVGAEALAVDGIVDKTVAKVILHTAMDVAATAGEEKHLKHEHRKEQRRLAAELRLRPSRSFVVEKTHADPEYEVAGTLRPSRSFVVEGDQRLLFQQPEKVQPQLLTAPLLRPSRSFEEDAYSDFEFTMAGALRSSASVVDGDDQVYQVPRIQQGQGQDQDEPPMTSPRAFMEKYPLISEYITSSDVSGQSGQAPAGVDASMLSGLFESFDEETLDELERDLEQAIEDMDEAWEGQPDANVSEDDAASIVTEKAVRTFEEPSDLETLVRRHSVLYTSSVKRRSHIPSVLMEEAPPAYCAEDFSDRPVFTDQKSGKAGPVYRSNSASTVDSFSSDGSLPPSYEHLRHPSTVSGMSMASTTSSYYPTSISSASSVSTMLTSYDQSTYSRTKPEYSPATPSSHMSASSWTSSVAPSIYTDSEKGRYSEPASPRRRSEYARSEYSTADSESRLSTTSRTSTIASRATSIASSTHQGLAKTKYFGLETATKLAVGGSLCLVGVRPSVQRKMLDKAKGKINQTREARHVDDDYREYA